MEIEKTLTELTESVYKEAEELRELTENIDTKDIELLRTIKLRCEQILISVSYMNDVIEARVF